LDKAHATNTHFFSGAQLEAIKGTHASIHGQQIRDRLNALIRQLMLNIDIWQAIKLAIQTATNPNKVRWDVRGGLMHGVEEYISSPVLSDPDVNAEIVSVWQHATMIREIVRRHIYRSLMLPEETRDEDYKTLVSLCDKATGSATSLVRRFLIAREELPPITL
jgi:hypothetical protein